MKLINKIVPLAVLGILGVTAFAAAADLSTWKSDFKSGAVVVGASAATQDIVAATDIAGVLGIQAIPVTGGGDSVLLKGSGDVLGYADDLDEMVPTGLDKNDLTTVLADDTFKESKGDTTNDVDYSQTLEFDPDAAATLTLALDINEDLSDEAAGTYLFFDSGDDIYDYTLEFDDDVEYVDGDETDDFDNAKIEILGKEYTITSVTADAGGLHILELMSGAVAATQGEYTTKTYTVDGKTYEVEVIIISDDAMDVKFKVNGVVTDALAEGDTFDVGDGMEIGVDEVMPNEGSEAAGADQVSFYMGAKKITLHDGDEIQINGKTLEDYTSLVTFTTTATTITQILVSIEPDDDMWLGVGGTWVDPVFGTWELTFPTLEKKTEMIDIDVSGGNDGAITFNNIAGDEIVIPVVLEDVSDDVAFGDDEIFIDADLANGEGATNAGVARNIGMAFTDTDSCAVTNAVGLTDECDGFLFMAVSATGEARIYSIRDVTVGAGGTFEIVDEQTGEEIDDDASCDSADTVEIPGMGTTFEFDCESDTDVFEFENIDLTATGHMVTELNGYLQLTYNANEAYVSMGDEATNEDIHHINDNAADDMIIELDAGLAWIDSVEDSDTEIALDAANWGIIYTNKDSTEDNDLTIEYPEEIEADSGISAKIYATELIGEAAGGTSKTYYTDAEATTTFAGKPVIAVGGSAINSISAKLLGLTAGTYGTDASWVSATGVDATGKGIIKVIDTPTVGSVAMLVAGYDAADTGVLGTILKEGALTLTGKSALIDTSGKKLITA